MIARAGRTLLWAAALAVAAAAVPAARAQYVLYDHAFCEWTVICAADQATGRQRCELRTPQPRFGGRGGDVWVGIVEPPAGNTALVLHIDRVVDAGRGVSLAVDGEAPHDAALTWAGDAAWHGAAAAAILAEMARGRVLAVRFFRRGAATASERRFALEGFNAARRTYLQRSAAAAAGRR